MNVIYTASKMSGAEKARRAANFLDFEQEILLNIVSKYLCFLKSKKRDHVSHKEKDNIWNRIADEFNTINKCNQPRESRVLRLKYDNIKKTLKRKLEVMTPLNSIELKWMDVLNNAMCNQNQQYCEQSISSSNYATISIIKPEIELTEGDGSNLEQDWSSCVTVSPVQAIRREQLVSTDSYRLCKDELRQFNTVHESLNSHTKNTSHVMPIAREPEMPQAMTQDSRMLPRNHLVNGHVQTDHGCAENEVWEKDNTLEDAKLELVRLQIEVERAQLKWCDKLNGLKATSLQLDIDKKKLELERIKNTNHIL